ncbi:alpha/beta hydrolase [Flexivirga endophytica]|uniref:Alpha/beta hydrolase n=1 Tax=Flexivirga endophytica TaxID=1849103 RepID=A0A916SVU9_9MICO|nr:alpha/beta hydrolase [Flexivirga endophytica]GGB18934.1 alpha/beta hydrolase [Flexivirga endophytica]GHB36729.1 alpha/beta hydrolase [Flexivirga endophytica]
MECRIDDVVIHYVEHGEGPPLVALHGVGVDHRELEAALEPILPEDGCRRIYPDLPAMGASTATGLTSNNDVVAVLAKFLERTVSGPALVLGHSYGAYLARGLAAQHPRLVAGLALICPLPESVGQVPAPEVVIQEDAAYDELDAELQATYDEYFVVRTPATARVFRDYAAPGMSLVDYTALTEIFTGWTIDMGHATFSRPTLVAAGLHDTTVGFDDAMRLLDVYPRATMTVIDGAGHALLHERPRALVGLLDDWIERARAAAE